MGRKYTRDTFKRFCGWVGPEIAKREFQVFGKGLKRFSIANQIEDYQGKKRMLYLLNRKVLGKDTENYRQEIGDCFPAGTMVRMADGSEKRIEEISPGEFVLSHLGNRKKVVSTIEKPYRGDILTIAANGQQSVVSATTDHRMLKVASDGSYLWVPISDLKKHDTILVPFGSRKIVKSSECITEHGFSCKVTTKTVSRDVETTVYCLEVEDDHSFIANGYAVHNCVSFGGKNVLEHLQCAQIALTGKMDKFRPIFPPYFYGTSRVQIGGGQMGNSDGSCGVWLQEAAKKYGVLAKDEKDVPPYSGSVAKEWGSSGPPDEFIPVGQKHLVKTTAQVLSVADAANAIYNGYPVAICSNQGFSMMPGADGFHQAQGNWGHCVRPNAIIFSNSPKKAVDTNIGDFVYGHDGKLHQVTEKFVRHYEGPMCRIHCGGSSYLTCTPEHPVYVFRQHLTFSDYEKSVLQLEIKPSWIPASEITKGDLVHCPRIPGMPRFAENTNLISDDYLTSVQNVDYVSYYGNVYNFEVDEVHSYIADGVSVHNCMSLIGFSDDKQRGLYFIILNSWGDVHGHLKDFDDQTDLPVGVLRVHGDVVGGMLQMEDSYAFSQFDGFPDQSGKIDKALFDIVGA